MCDAASCRIVGIGLAVRIVIVRSFDLVSSAIWRNGKSHAIRNGDLIAIKNVTMGSARTAGRLDSSRNFPTIIGHNGLHNNGSILNVRLGGGVPGGLALVQVDRDGHGGKDADDDDDHEQFDEGEALLALGTAVECVTYALHNEPFFPIGRTYRGTVQLRMVHSDSSLRYFPLWGWLAHITNNSQRSRIDIVCSTRCSAPIAPMMFHPPFSSQPRIKLFQYDCITPLHTITTIRFRNMR